MQLEFVVQILDIQNKNFQFEISLVKSLKSGLKVGSVEPVEDSSMKSTKNKPIFIRYAEIYEAHIMDFQQVKWFERLSDIERYPGDCISPPISPAIPRIFLRVLNFIYSLP